MKTSIVLQALAFSDRPVCVSIPRYQRVVVGLMGVISTTVPIVVLHTGCQRRAERLRDRLRKHGYQDVMVKREKRG